MAKINYKEAADKLNEFVYEVRDRRANYQIRVLMYNVKHVGLYWSKSYIR